MKKKFRITLNGKHYDVVAEVIGEEETAPAAESHGGRRARSAGASAVAAPAPVKAPLSASPGDVPSPLAGKVVSIDVSVGDTVEAGQNVITLEAMKMNTVVSSPGSGTVKAILIKPGDAVEEGQSLLTLQ